MTKIEIVNQIIDLIKNNGSGINETGILKLSLNDVTIKYFVALKELWQFCEISVITKKTCTKKLAKLMTLNTTTELVESVSELELLVILDELKNHINAE